MIVFHKFSILVLLAIILQAASAKNVNRTKLYGPRIINGTAAELENTRHQVSIRLWSADYNYGYGHQCGGSVISPTRVLTAAHCVYIPGTNIPRRASEFKVVMGGLNRVEETNETLIFSITHFVRPNSFNITTLKDDIAIFFLDGVIPDDHPTVRAIELNTEPIEDGTICQVTGWGDTGDYWLANDLQTIDVPMINSTKCKELFEEDFRDGMMCAGYLQSEKDACQGDSGGPMVCNGKLAGIISWGYDCAEFGYPGVYTNISYFRDWMKAENGIPGSGHSLTGSVAIVMFSLLVMCLGSK